MKIGIDVDDCISNTAEVDYATCWEYNKNIHPNDNKKYCGYFHNAPTIFGFTKEEDTEFYIKQRQICLQQNLIQPKIFANKFINKMLSDGHETIILTSRNDLFWGDALKQLKKWLKKYKIKYTKCFANSNKPKDCVKYEIDIMIDDNLECIKKYNELGVKSIYFNNNFIESYYPKELRGYTNPLNKYASCWCEVYHKIL